MATLIPLEPCSRAFFKKADLNKDRLISKQEWGLAMKLGEGDSQFIIYFIICWAGYPSPVDLVSVTSGL